ncbi:MAG TPA: archaeosortase/exosortase family protein, partial [Candidatus Sulfotelmatobacter sp.]|nr:archaeosortase/exosortase family protein [Candidatus Sulfotelmatobacter sp.]
MADVLGNDPLFEQISRDGARQAIFASAAVLFWLGVFGLMFPAAVLGAFHVWVVSPTFNHCFLIAPMSLFLIWHRRTWLAGMTPVPDFRAAMAILLIGLAWTVSFFAGVLEAQQFVI